MANQKISALTALAGVDVAVADDVLAIVDTSVTTTKKIAVAELFKSNAVATFTPAIAFGGATTGITYTTQAGFYVTLGNIIAFMATVIVNDNGSASGNATITGLPVASKNTANLTPPLSVAFSGLAAGVAGQAAVIPANSTTINLYGFTAGTIIALNEAGLINGSDLRVAGFYFI